MSDEQIVKSAARTYEQLFDHAQVRIYPPTPERAAWHLTVRYRYGDSSYRSFWVEYDPNTGFELCGASR